MTGTITKTVKCVAQLLASVTMLLMTMGVPPAAAMTMEEVTAAYERGNYTIARFLCDDLRRDGRRRRTVHAWELHCASLPVVDGRAAEDILVYDERGLLA